MLTDTDLTEIERLCKARPDQHFADLVRDLVAAYRTVCERTANAWAEANMDRQALIAARQEALDAAANEADLLARLEACTLGATRQQALYAALYREWERYEEVYRLACALERAVRECNGIAAAEQALLKAVAIDG